MKTAISVPDQVFRAAERVARRLGLSRSELYSRAVADYVAEHDDDHVTEALDAVYADRDSSMDEILVNAQASSLPADGW